jgi:carbamoyl-phosphate synthase large subunit
LPGKLLGADSDPNSPALRVSTPNCVLPAFSDAECLARLLEFCRREAVHAVIPLTNKAIEFLDANRAAFAGEGIRPLVNDGATIETCHDKYEFARFCRRAGISAPETFLAGSFAEDAVPFPLICKPRVGEGGKNLLLAENRRDLDYCREKHPGHVIQPFIAGREFSIDWYSEPGANPAVIVPRERVAARGGEVTTSRIDLRPDIVAAARDLGAKLGLQGPCTLQGILDASGRFYFTDVNLRFGSGYVHTIAAGADVPLMIYRRLRGEPPPPAAASRVRDGSLMLRYTDAFFP